MVIHNILFNAHSWNTSYYDAYLCAGVHYLLYFTPIHGIINVVATPLTRGIISVHGSTHSKSTTLVYGTTAG